MEYYERTYKRFQDVISDIGGINQVITLIAICMNSLYHNFVVLCDTEILLQTSIYNEKENHKKNQLNIKI